MSLARLRLAAGTLLAVAVVLAASGCAGKKAGGARPSTAPSEADRRSGKAKPPTATPDETAPPLEPPGGGPPSGVRPRPGYDRRVESLAGVDASALRGRKIVLDPGHGGSDEGTKTPAGLTEKILALDVAQRTALKLLAAGFEVSLTREADTKIYLRDRVRYANQSRADLFVSIHFNWFKDGRSNRGIETYYLGPSDDPFVTALASAENR